MFTSEGSAVTIALAGDAILTRQWSVCEEKPFQKIIKIIRETDVSFVNLEVLLNDFEGYPAAQSGGTYMSSPPDIADELLWAGFDICSAATNHTGDYSHGGVEATIRTLENHDLAYAGIGRNLADARSPGYLDTSQGRVSLVSASSTFTRGSEAGHQRPDLQGRPGLSPLRLETEFIVNRETIETINTLSSELELDEVKESIKNHGSPMFEDEDAETTYFFNPGGPHLGSALKFKVGDSSGVRRRPKPADKSKILKQIDVASRQSDWVIASLHTHEGRNGRINECSVPSFLESFARECIDAGADVFVAHGSHVLSGIEIYEEAPLFYGLGNIARQNDTVTRLPAEIYERYGLDMDAQPADLYDARMYDGNGDPRGVLQRPRYWETIVPVCRFEKGNLSEIEIYPVDLAMDSPRPRRGRPLLAEDDRAAQIIDRVSSLSKKYSTTIEKEGDFGIISI